MTVFGEDEFEAAFPGCDFIHVLRIVTTLDVPATRSVLDGVAESGCSLVSLNVATRRDRLEHLLHVQGITASDVRRLAAGWQARDRFLRVDVEHQIMSRKIEK